jgi:hypothetical protein
MRSWVEKRSRHGGVPSVECGLITGWIAQSKEKKGALAHEEIYPTATPTAFI